MITYKSICEKLGDVDTYQIEQLDDEWLIDDSQPRIWEKLTDEVMEFLYQRKIEENFKVDFYL